MNLVALLPARYAKLVASLVGDLVIYLQIYGTTWHLKEAVILLAASAGVAGVPNAAKPAPATPQVPTS